MRCEIDGSQVWKNLPDILALYAINVVCGLFQNQPVSENRYLSLLYCTFTTAIYIPYVDTFILLTLSVIFITFNIDNPYDLYAVIRMVLSVK